MNKEKLIKNGKFYNPETLELIATSSWFSDYDTQRIKVYKTAKGVFFMVKEIAETLCDGHAWAILKDGTRTGLGSVTLSQFSVAPKDDGFRDDVKIKDVHVIMEISEDNVRSKYENANRGLMTQFGTYAKGIYKFHKSYSELFSIEEA